MGADEAAVLRSTGSQEQDGDLLILRENAEVFTQGSYLRADEIIRNLKTGQVTAKGNVFYQNYADGNKLSCETADYNVQTETGTFYKVLGSSPAHIDAKPGMLTTNNPFYFEGEFADKTKDRYVLHNGFVSDCKPGNLWWRQKANRFDIVPGDRAIAHRSTMYLKGVPIFYFPWYRKSLEKQARHSGFLTPNMGNSSRRGQTVGLGYFWAINRSYDATYRTQYYSQRGFVHEGNFEGWINSKTNFNVTAFGARDYTKTHVTTNSAGVASRILDSYQPGGYVISAEIQSKLGRGWEARGELRDISSLAFRQEFTYSFNEAINSETHSVGFISKHWKDYGFNLVAQRNVNFQTGAPGDTVIIRKLPEAEFLVREHALGTLPAWFSLDSSYGLERRTQPLFQTRQFVQRLDFAPRIRTAWHWMGLDLSPSFGIRQTMYDSRRTFTEDPNNPTKALISVSGTNLMRSSRDVQFDLGLPRLSRILAAPRWLETLGLGKGEKVKHVVEARARYRYVTGINDFQQTVRFDEADLLSNTHEVEFSLTNRLLRRDGAGGVNDVVSWQLWYKRYLDPTFGGAIIPGFNRRYVIDAATDITGYAFINQPRNQSPIASVFRVQSRVGVEWRADYDPVRKNIVNSTISIDTRVKQLLIVVGHSQLRTVDVLAPKANQLRGQIQYGGDNRRGWNYGLTTGYDYLKGGFQYLQSQATYNTDCCGFSVQYRRFNFNVISDNQYRFAFVIANIGSFGTLRRQERIF